MEAGVGQTIVGDHLERKLYHYPITRKNDVQGKLELNHGRKTPLSEGKNAKRGTQSKIKGRQNKHQENFQIFRMSWWTPRALGRNIKNTPTKRKKRVGENNSKALMV